MSLWEYVGGFAFLIYVLAGWTAITVHAMRTDA